MMSLSEKPQISIVTPSYNQGEYIEEAIKSVVDQQFPSFEHIIIDNCSTDETLSIVKNYSHLRFISEPDDGQSDALNKGFSLAKGEIIGWLNADDYYLPNTFKKVEYALKNPKWSGVYSNVKFIDKEGKFTRNLIVHRAMRLMSLFHCYIPSTTFFFRRQILESGIEIDKGMHISMDKDFFAHILFRGYKLRFINDFFAAFRWHDGNKSLDTKEVKKLRNREGLRILYRYLGISLNINDFSIGIYKLTALYFMIVRKGMKLFNFRYDLPNDNSILGE